MGSPAKYTHLDATKYQARKVLESLKVWHLMLEVRPQALDPQHSDFLPKRYVHDLGVVNRFRSMAVPSVSLLRTLDLPLRGPLGGLFENAVLLGLLEGASAKKKVGTWRKSAGSVTEVDFVIEGDTPGTMLPIECKATLAARRRHVEGLVEYLKTTRQRIGVLVSASPLATIYQGDDCRVLNIPAYLATRGNILRYTHDESLTT